MAKLKPGNYDMNNVRSTASTMRGGNAKGIAAGTYSLADVHKAAQRQRDDEELIKKTATAAQTGTPFSPERALQMSGQGGLWTGASNAMEKQFGAELNNPADRADAIPSKGTLLRQYDKELDEKIKAQDEQIKTLQNQWAQTSTSYAGRRDGREDDLYRAQRAEAMKAQNEAKATKEYLLSRKALIGENLIVFEAAENGDLDLFEDYYKEHVTNQANRGQSVLGQNTGESWLGTLPTEVAYAQSSVRENTAKNELKKRGYTDEQILHYINARNGEGMDALIGDVKEFTAKHPIIAEAAKVATVPVRGIAGALGMVMAPGEKHTGYSLLNEGARAINETESALISTAIEATANKIGIQGKGAKTLGKLGTLIYSAADSALESAVAMGTGGHLGELMLGLSAATDAYNEALDNGLPTGRAITTGVVAGVFETLFEHLSLENLRGLSVDTSNVGSFIGKKGFINFLKSAFTEGSEEFFTDIANEAYDYLVNGGYSNFQRTVRDLMAEGMSEEKARKQYARDFGLQLAEDFAVGAMSGGMGFGSRAGVVNARVGTETSNIGRAVRQMGRETEGGVQGVLKTLGSKETEGLTDKSGSYKVGRATLKAFDEYDKRFRQTVKTTAEQAGTENTVKQIDGMLQEAGLHESEAGKVAQAYVDFMTQDKVAYSTLRTIATNDAAVEYINNQLSGDNYSAARELRNKILETASEGRINQKIKKKLEKWVHADEFKRAEAQGEVLKKSADAVQTGETAQLITESVKASTADGQVQVKGIAGIEDGKIKVTVDESGATDDLDNITFDETKDGIKGRQIYTAVADMMRGAGDYNVKMSATAANLVIALAQNTDTPVEVFLQDAYEAYKAGTVMRSRDTVEVETDYAISNKEIEAMYAAGAAEYKVQKGVTRIGTQKMTEAQTNMLQVLDRFFMAHNLSLIVVDNLWERTRLKDYRLLGANYTDTQGTDVIVIALNAGRNQENVLDLTAYHELFHWLKKQGPDGRQAAQEMIDGINEGAKAKDPDGYREMVDELKEVGYTADEIAEEIACQYIGTLMSAESFRQQAANDEEAAAAWGDSLPHLKDFYDGVRGYIKQTFGYDKRVQTALEEDVDTAAGWVARFESTLSYVQTQGGANKQGDIAQQSDYSRAMDMQMMDDADALNKEMIRKNTSYVSPQTMYQARRVRYVIKDMLQRAEYDAKGNRKLLLPEDIAGKGWVKNGAYGRTVEPTTVCPRSVGFDRLSEMIAGQIGRPLTVEESLAVAQNIGLLTNEIQCLYCYVAADRMAYNQAIIKFINDRDAVMEMLRSGEIKTEAEFTKEYLKLRGVKKASKPIKALVHNYMEAYRNGGKLIQLSDMTDLNNNEGRLNKIRERLKDSGMLDEFEALRSYAQSATWAKKRVDYMAYSGDILTWKEEDIKALNEQFGLRFYSFSDFSAAFILDNMQAITDAAVRGLKGLAYTKATDFVRIFAPTGININVSVFGQMVDGQMVADEMQGASWAETKELRSKYKNVGAVFVAMDDASVEWALEQDWIDVVIPYHTVHAGGRVTEFFSWEDYKATQEDKKAKGWKKGDLRSIPPHLHNNDKETYLRLLEENHLEPRFPQWLGNDNYMKLVNETRLSAAETPTLQPVFNQTAAMKSIQKMEQSGSYLEPLGGSNEAMQAFANVMSEQLKVTDEADLRDLQVESAAFAKEMGRLQKEADGNNSLSRALDSSGRKLTEGQQAYFADSKIRDEKGRLMVMYHGTDAKFTVFDTSVSGGKNGRAEGYGIYLSDTQEVTEHYGERQIEAYVNIKRPAYADRKTITRKELSKLIKTMCEREAGRMVEEDEYDSVNDALRDTWVSNYVYTYEYGSMSSVYDDVAGKILSMVDNDADIVYELMNGSGVYDYESAMQFYDEMLTPVTGIDGIWQKWTNENTGVDANVILAFRSEQIKNVTNENPTTDKDIRYSRALDEAHDEYVRIGEELQEAVQQLSVVEYDLQHSKEYEQYQEMISHFDPNNIEELKRIRAAYRKLESDSAVRIMQDKVAELRKQYNDAYLHYQSLYKKEKYGDEQDAIQKSGLPESDYFDKLALKEFGTTTDWNETGYLLRNGKRLNFSGEKGVHYGMRGEDHRGIGAIFQAEDGSKAMMRFINYGNIRVMAEAPGVDISAQHAPTNAQYGQIMDMVRNSARSRYFSVDFSNEDGSRAGYLQYEGSFSPTKVINDIKHYYETGEIRGQSDLQRFRYSYAGVGSETADKEALARAEQLEKDGESNETIRQTTGWFRSMDGKWRYEIDNSEMRFYPKGNNVKLDGQSRINALMKKYGTTEALKQRKLELAQRFRMDDNEEYYHEHYQEYRDIAYILRFGTKYTIDNTEIKHLEDYLRHPALYAAYPFLKKILFMFDDLPHGWRGAYSNGIVESISLSNALIGDNEQIKRTLLHEIQHAIQSFEGFATGSNSDYWRYIIEQAKTYKNDRSETGKQLKEQIIEQYGEHEKQNVLRAARLAVYVDQGNASFSDIDELELLRAHFKDVGIEDIAEKYIQNERELWQLIRYIRSLEDNGDYNNYYKTAGEIEARDVATRFDYDKKAKSLYEPDITQEGVRFTGELEAGTWRKYSRVLEGTASLSDERFDDLIKYSGRGERTDYAEKWITSISPSAFLMLTLPDEIDRETFDVRPNEFGSTMDTYDFMAELKRNIITPYLAVDYKTGKVVGHEGRHRMRALERAGIKEVPVVIEYRTDENKQIRELNGRGNPLETIAEQKLLGQFSEWRGAVVRNVIPLNEAHREEARAAYVNQNAGIHYSRVINQNAVEYVERLKSGSRQLWEMIDILEDRANEIASLREYLGAAPLDMAALRRIAKKYNHSFDHSKAYVESLAMRLAKAQEMLATGANVDTVLYGLYKIAEDEWKNTGRWEVVNEDAQEFIDYLRPDGKMPVIFMDESTYSSVAAHFGGRKAFRDRIAGKFVVTTDEKRGGTALDDFYTAAQDQNKFPLEDTTEPSKQMENMLEIYESGRETQLVDTAEDRDLVGETLAERATDDAFNMLRDLLYPEKMGRDQQLKAEAARLDELQEYVQTERRRGIQSTITRADEELQKRLEELSRSGKTTVEIEIERDRLKQEYRMEALRRAYAQRIESVREYYKEQAQKEAMRRDIKRNLTALMNLFNKESDSQHVPEVLKKTVLGFLAMFDKDRSLITAANMHRIAEFADEIRDVGEDEIPQEYAQLFGRFDEDIRADINELIKKIEKIETDQGMRVHSSMLSLDDMRVLNNTAEHIRFLVESANEAFVDGKRKKISAIAENIIAKAKSVTQSAVGKMVKNSPVYDFIATKMLTPINFFDEKIGGAMADVYEGFRNGQDEWFRRVAEGKNVLDKAKDKYHYKDWKDKKIHFSFPATLDRSAWEVDMPIEAVLQIYATLERERRSGKDTAHLTSGGVVLGDELTAGKGIIEKLKGLTEKGAKAKIAQAAEQAEQQANANRHQLSWEELLQITQHPEFTKEMKDYADAIVKYMSTDVSRYGNEATMALSGIRKFNEEYYFPFQSAKNYLYTRLGVSDDTRLKNAGFTKRVKYGANTPLVLSGFTSVAANHIQQMALFSTMTVPIDTLQRVINYQQTAIDENGNVTKAEGNVKTAISNAYGKSALSYINTFVTQVNGGIRTDPLDSLWNKGTSMFKRAAVMGNMSVVVQQPTALMRGMAIIGPKYIFGKASKTDYKDMLEHAPIAGIKEQGGFDTGTGRGAVAWMLDEATPGQRITELWGKPAAIADAVAWTNLWNGCKRETRDKHPELEYGSDAFYDAVYKRFRDIVDYTQVYDSTLSKNELMRGAGGLTKMVTAFMAEPSLSLNMLMMSGKGRKINKGRALAAFAANIIINSMFKAIVAGWRDKDDDESYSEKWLEHFISDLVGDKNVLFLDGAWSPVGMIPWVKDILSLWQGYNVDRSDVSAISDLIESAKGVGTAFDKFDGTWQSIDLEAIADFAGSISAIGPMPMEKAIQDVMGITRVIFNKTVRPFEISWETARQTALEGMGFTTANAEKAYDAAMRNNTEYIRRQLEPDAEKIEQYIAAGNTPSEARANAMVDARQKWENAVKNGILAKDERAVQAAEARYNGDTNRYELLVDEMVADGLPRNSVIGAIKSLYDALKPEEAENKTLKDKNLYTTEDLDRAVRNNDLSAWKHISEELTIDGKSEDTISNVAKFYAKELAEDGDGKSARQVLTTFAGMGDNAAAAKVRSWQHPNGLSADKWVTYYDKVADTGISADVYEDYATRAAACKGTDENGDGKTDSGSKKEQVIKVIDSLPISKDQKDALYRLNGWAESKLSEAPWH